MENNKLNIFSAAFLLIQALHHPNIERIGYYSDLRYTPTYGKKVYRVGSNVKYKGTEYQIISCNLSENTYILSNNITVKAQEITAIYDNPKVLLKNDFLKKFGCSILLQIFSYFLSLYSTSLNNSIYFRTNLTFHFLQKAREVIKTVFLSKQISGNVAEVIDAFQRQYIKSMAPDLESRFSYIPLNELQASVEIIMNKLQNSHGFLFDKNNYNIALDIDTYLETEYKTQKVASFPSKIIFSYNQKNPFDVLSFFCEVMGYDRDAFLSAAIFYGNEIYVKTANEIAGKGNEDLTKVQETAYGYNEPWKAIQPEKATLMAYNGGAMNRITRRNKKRNHGKSNRFRRSIKDRLETTATTTTIVTTGGSNLTLQVTFLMLIMLAQTFYHTNLPGGMKWATAAEPPNQQRAVQMPSMTPTIAPSAEPSSAVVPIDNKVDLIGSDKQVISVRNVQIQSVVGENTNIKKIDDNFGAGVYSGSFVRYFNKFISIGGQMQYINTLSVAGVFNSSTGELVQGVILADKTYLYDVYCNEYGLPMKGQLYKIRELGLPNFYQLIYDGTFTVYTPNGDLIQNSYKHYHLFDSSKYGSLKYDDAVQKVILLKNNKNFNRIQISNSGVLNINSDSFGIIEKKVESTKEYIIFQNCVYVAVKPSQENLENIPEGEGILFDNTGTLYHGGFSGNMFQGNGAVVSFKYSRFQNPINAEITEVLTSNNFNAGSANSFSVQKKVDTNFVARGTAEKNAKNELVYNFAPSTSELVDVKKLYSELQAYEAAISLKQKAQESKSFLSELGFIAGNIAAGIIFVPPPLTVSFIAAVELWKIISLYREDSRLEKISRDQLLLHDSTSLNKERSALKGEDTINGAVAYFSTNGKNIQKLEVNVTNAINATAKTIMKLRAEAVPKLETYTYPNGDVYKGQLKGNQKHGKGVYTLSNGIEYAGEFADDKINGHGTIFYPNGDKIEGKFQDNKPILALLTKADGTALDIVDGNIIEKPFIKDYKIDEIQVVSANQDVRQHTSLFTGKFLPSFLPLPDLNSIKMQKAADISNSLCLYCAFNNNFFPPNTNVLSVTFDENSDITGYIDYTNSISYYGTISGNKPHGTGLLFKDKKTFLYDGQWNEGLMTGYGETFTENNKDLYKGFFRNGIRHGVGVLQKDNTEIVGLFVNDNMIKTAIKVEEPMQFDEDLTFTGYSIDGLASGICVVTNADGVLVYDGFCSDGKFNGFGRSYDVFTGQISYEGQFLDNKPNGLGQNFYSSGSVAQEGFFNDGFAVLAQCFQDGKPNATYAGELSYNLYEGVGTMYDDNGHPICTGNFKSNTPTMIDSASAHLQVSSTGLVAYDTVTNIDFLTLTSTQHANDSVSQMVIQQNLDTFKGQISSAFDKLTEQFSDLKQFSDVQKTQLLEDIFYYFIPGTVLSQKLGDESFLKICAWYSVYFQSKNIQIPQISYVAESAVDLYNKQLNENKSLQFKTYQDQVLTQDIQQNSAIIVDDEAGNNILEYLIASLNNDIKSDTSSGTELTTTDKKKINMLDHDERKFLLLSLTKNDFFEKYSTQVEPLLQKYLKAIFMGKFVDILQDVANSGINPEFSTMHKAITAPEFIESLSKTVSAQPLSLTNYDATIIQIEQFVETEVATHNLNPESVSSLQFEGGDKFYKVKPVNPKQPPVVQPSEAPTVQPTGAPTVVTAPETSTYVFQPIQNTLDKSVINAAYLTYVDDVVKHFNDAIKQSMEKVDPREAEDLLRNAEEKLIQLEEQILAQQNDFKVNIKKEELLNSAETPEKMKVLLRGQLAKNPTSALEKRVEGLKAIVADGRKSLYTLQPQFNKGFASFDFDLTDYVPETFGQIVVPKGNTATFTDGYNLQASSPIDSTGKDKKMVINKDGKRIFQGDANYEDRVEVFSLKPQKGKVYDDNGNLVLEGKLTDCLSINPKRCINTAVLYKDNKMYRGYLYGGKFYVTPMTYDELEAKYKSDRANNVETIEEARRELLLPENANYAVTINDSIKAAEKELESFDAQWAEEKAKMQKYNYFGNQAPIVQPTGAPSAIPSETSAYVFEPIQTLQDQEDIGITGVINSIITNFNLVMTNDDDIQSKADIAAIETKKLEDFLLEQKLEIEKTNVIQNLKKSGLRDITLGEPIHVLESRIQKVKPLIAEAKNSVYKIKPDWKKDFTTMKFELRNYVPPVFPEINKVNLNNNTTSFSNGYGLRGSSALGRGGTPLDGPMVLTRNGKKIFEGLADYTRQDKIFNLKPQEGKVYDDNGNLVLEGKLADCLSINPNKCVNRAVLYKDGKMYRGYLYDGNFYVTPMTYDQLEAKYKSDRVRYVNAIDDQNDANSITLAEKELEAFDAQWAEEKAKMEKYNYFGNQAPSQAPTVQPTEAPSVLPNAMPTLVPKKQPLTKPAPSPAAPSTAPSAAPIVAPAPPKQPLNKPVTTIEPEIVSTPPSAAPTVEPAPSAAPTAAPTAAPSAAPSAAPTVELEINTTSPQTSGPQTEAGSSDFTSALFTVGVGGLTLAGLVATDSLISASLNNNVLGGGVPPVAVGAGAGAPVAAPNNPLGIANLLPGRLVRATRAARALARNVFAAGPGVAPAPAVAPLDVLNQLINFVDGLNTYRHEPNLTLKNTVIAEIRTKLATPAGTNELLTAVAKPTIDLQTLKEAFLFYVDERRRLAMNRPGFFQFYNRFGLPNYNGHVDALSASLQLLYSTATLPKNTTQQLNQVLKCISKLCDPVQYQAALTAFAGSISYIISNNNPSTFLDKITRNFRAKLGENMPYTFQKLGPLDAATAPVNPQRFNIMIFEQGGSHNCPLIIGDNLKLIGKIVKRENFNYVYYDYLKKKVYDSSYVYDLGNPIKPEDDPYTYACLYRNDSGLFSTFLNIWSRKGGRGKGKKMQKGNNKKTRKQKKK